MADKLRVVAQQALEFVTSKQWGTVPYMDGNVYSDAKELEGALRAALAQAEPVQEPVAWMRPDNRVAEESYSRTQFSRGRDKPPIGTWTPLYTAPQQQAEPVLQTCNCRWDGDVQVQQCTLHEAHVDAIHEWAERAKVAERKLAQQAEPVQFDPAEAMRLADNYAYAQSEMDGAHFVNRLYYVKSRNEARAKLAVYLGIKEAK